MKKLLKILGVMLLFPVAIALLIQMPQVKHFVMNKTLEAVNKNLNGSISAGTLRGTLFTSLYLDDVAVTLANGDTLLAVRQLSLNYSPLRLLRREVWIDSAVISNPSVHLSADSCGVWNFTALLPPGKPDTDTASAKAQLLPVSIYLGAVRLNGGSVTICDSALLTPSRISDIDIDFGGRYTRSNHISAKLNRLAFVMQEPHLELKNMNLNVDFDGIKWKLSNMNLATALNTLSAKAEYSSMADRSATVGWSNMELAEFAFALPDLSIPAKPDLELDVAESENRLKINFCATYAGESLSIQGSIDSVRALITDSLRHMALLNMDVKLNNVRPATWINMESLQSLPLVVNASIHIGGNGLIRHSVPLRIEGSLEGTGWNGIVLNKGDIVATYTGGTVEVKTDVAGLFGALQANVQCNAKQLDAPFRASVKTHRLNLHRLLPDVLDSTIVSLSLNAEGRGLLPDTMQAVFDGRMVKSTVEYIAVDTLVFDGAYSGGNIRLNSLKLVNRSLAAVLQGFYNKNGTLGADVAASVYSTGAFGHYFTSPASWDTALIQGEVHGSIDSLNFGAQLGTSQLVVDSVLTVGKLSVKTEGQMVNKTIFAQAVAGLSALEAWQVKTDTAMLAATLNDTLFTVALNAEHPNSIHTALYASGSWGNRIEVLLNRLSLDAPFASLQLYKPAVIAYADSVATLRGLQVINQNDSAFQFNADAFVSILDSVNINASVNNLQLSALSKTGLMEQPVEGMAGLQLHIGTLAKKITVTADATVTGLQYNPVNIHSITASLYHTGDTAQFIAGVHNSAGDSIQLSVITPLTAKIDDSITVSWPQTVAAHLLASNVQLKDFLQPVGDVQPSALVNISLDAAGAVSSPSVNGTVSLSQGTLPLPHYGIDYRDIQLKLSVNNTDIQLDSLFVRHRRGTMLAQGAMQLNSLFASQKITGSDITLKADEFYLSTHRNHEAQIDADIHFKSSGDTPSFQGNLTLLRANINLPAIMDITSGSEAVGGEPLLVKAMHSTVNMPETADTLPSVLPDTVIIRPAAPHPFVQQLTGMLKVDMPRNIWIKSNDMQVELFGNLDLVKTGTDFELFGTLGIQRGFYTLYGKKLTVSEGQITFTGGTDFNPAINLNASYIFHTPARDRHELLLAASGQLATPAIEFQLDGQPLPEADAVSYIVFGQPFDQLSFGSQQGITGNLPSKMLSGLLSSQLSKTIGNTLHLDMIEINAGDNWQNATFMIGKYITNSLFVTYQRSFGEADLDNLAQETITLEYELTRHISLRLVKSDIKSTGIDMIIKFEK